MSHLPLVGLRVAVFASTLFAASSAWGQVISVTVGIQPRCPYGLGACWPEAYDGLRLIDGVKSVDTRPSLETWTGTIRTKDDALPDPAAWSRAFTAIVGGTFGFRGVEVTVEGDIVDENGHLTLKVSGSGTVLRLAPLGRKIQWDPEKKCEQAATAAERTAYRRLADRAKTSSPGKSARVRIIGPLDGPAPGRPPIVSVRDFTWY
jgi:galactose oxidase